MKQAEPSPDSQDAVRPKRFHRRLLLVPLVLILCLYAVSLFSWTRSTAGLVNGRLRPCPESPNCVCSQTSEPNVADSIHDIDPIRFEGDPAQAWSRLEAVLSGLPRVATTERTGNYLRTEFTTPILRFVDDVEFLLDPANGVIHVRSCSRVGYGDLGTNRRRVEMIRDQFHSAVQ